MFSLKPSADYAKVKLALLPDRHFESRQVAGLNFLLSLKLASQITLELNCLEPALEVLQGPVAISIIKFPIVQSGVILTSKSCHHPKYHREYEPCVSRCSNTSSGYVDRSLSGPVYPWNCWDSGWTAER